MENQTNSKTKLVKAYGATGNFIGGTKLEPMDIERQEPKADEVYIEVLYCGVCHSDIHQVNNDWKNTLYPCVPGHEIVGRIIQIGSLVSKHKTGDIVGVGCMVDSCKHCEPCNENEEQFCEGPRGQTMTYNGYWKPNGHNTFGGYSTGLVANEKFVFPIPAGLVISKAAPLLCAGITTYAPLKRAGIKQGNKVGIIGIGGLGHIAVKIAKAMGARVTAITTKEDKRNDALQLGANEVLIVSDEKAMAEAEASFHFMLCTIPYPFDVNPFVKLIRRRGSLITVGLLGPYEKELDNSEVARLSRNIGGSIIGGTAETQEMLEFCSKYNILPEVEMIQMQDINEAFEKIKNEEVRFRYVIDMKSLKG